MSDVSDAKCTCCKKLNDYCCKVPNTKDACCTTEGNIAEESKHDWSNKNQCGNATITMHHTQEELKCKTDGDCHRLDPNMGCVRRFGIVTFRNITEDGKQKRMVYYDEKTEEGGKCTLDLTEIDKALCKNDEDCQKANFHEVGGNPADMVCVSHYGTVETIIEGNQMVVQTKLNETEYGKCTLGTQLPNIVDTIMANMKLTNLSSTITHLLNHGSAADGLLDQLTGKGPFTVFAPNDAAFEKIKDSLKDLMKPEKANELKKVILRHIVQQEHKANSIKEGTHALKTLGGEEISVVKTTTAKVKKTKIVETQVRVNYKDGGAHVIETDLMAGNGVIHILDSVLV